ADAEDERAVALDELRERGFVVVLEEPPEQIRRRGWIDEDRHNGFLAIDFRHRLVHDHERSCLIFGGANEGRTSRNFPSRIPGKVDAKAESASYLTGSEGSRPTRRATLQLLTCSPPKGAFHRAE